MEECFRAISIAFFRQDSKDLVIVTNFKVIKHLFEHNVHWESRDAPKHQEERRITRSLMNCGVIGKREGPLWALVFFLKGTGTEHVTQSVIESLCSHIAHGMVGCCVGLCNTSQMKSLRCDQVALEIGALIGTHYSRAFWPPALLSDWHKEMHGKAW